MLGSENLHCQRYWAEIDLDHLQENYRQAQKLAPGQKLICVIKADAYGLGAVPIARSLAAVGAAHFGVASAEEALQLRQHGIEQEILIMGMVSPAWTPRLTHERITIAIGDLSTAASYAALVPPGEQLRVHLAIDTGMNRIGFLPELALAQTRELLQLPRLTLEGVFTHLAAAEDPKELDFTRLQIQRFDRVLGDLRQAGLEPPLRHLANSATLIRFGPDLAAELENTLTAARPGIILYGVNPVADRTPDLQPVLSLRARVMKVKSVPAGQSLSYGRIWSTQRTSQIATLGVGYADGLARCLSSRIPMLLQGQRVPQVGRICMDQCMLDVTGLSDVAEGDRVTILGTDGAEQITLDELAAAGGIIPAELLIGLGQRVPRLYYRNGELAEQLSYLSWQPQVTGLR